MKAYYIKTLRDFSRRLFLESFFDEYLLIKGRFVTAFTTEFEGSAPEENPSQPYIAWGQLKALAFQLIKGNVAPRSFSLVLAYPPEKTRALLSPEQRKGEPKELPLLLLNIRYREEKLLLSTGISEKSFNPHSQTAPLWDSQLLRILEELGLSEAIYEL